MSDVNCFYFVQVQLYFITIVLLNRAIRFKGYQQQDSHELLRYLLDGMRSEEMQVSANFIVVQTCLLHAIDEDFPLC